MNRISQRAAIQILIHPSPVQQESFIALCAVELVCGKAEGGVQLHSHLSV